MNDTVTLTPEQIADLLSPHDLGELKLREPMSDHITMRVGGPADVFLIPRDRDALKKAVRIIREHKLPWLALGNGSNLLVRDGGFYGVVISLKCLDKMEILDEAQGRVFVEAGVHMTRLIRAGVEAGFEQIWMLGGIPGTLGGAVRMNAGTRYGEIQAVIESIEVMSLAGTVKTIPRAELEFAYRTLTLAKDRIVLGATLVFGHADPEQVRSKHKEVMKYRSDTQPLTLPSVGSVFRNPPPNARGEAAAAGKLIELSGLKGVRVRGAQISDKHANWIVNVGGAKCSDVLTLVRMIKDRVKHDHGVHLELEAKVVGREAEEPGA